MAIMPFEGGQDAFNRGGFFLFLINLVFRAGRRSFTSSAFILFFSQPIH